MAFLFQFQDDGKLIEKQSDFVATYHSSLCADIFRIQKSVYILIVACFCFVNIFRVMIQVVQDNYYRYTVFNLCLRLFFRLGISHFLMVKISKYLWEEC